MIAILSGTFAGFIHVLSGPDHLAALAPLSVERRDRAWMPGLRWGFGHATGVIVVGLLSIWLRELLPLELLSAWAERLVGVVLIGIGLWGMRKALQNHVHTHEHIHEGRTHAHIHVHSHEVHEPHVSARPHRHTHAAFAVGTLHGVAGSSHFLGVLPALAFPTAGQAAIYLLAFGAGTMVAMTSFSSVINWGARYLAAGGTGAYRTALISCSAGAMLMGSYWLIAKSL